MDHSQLQEMKKTWQEKSRRNKREEMERKNNAIDTANKIADYLKNKYSVQKVYLFGSLIWGKHFSASSDIDLFVTGFPDSENYWEAHVAVEHMAVPFPVSLVLADQSSPSLKDKVEKEGLLL